MRKFLALGVAIGVLAFGLAFATPAKADVDVHGWVSKLKIKFVGELILKLKLVHLQTGLAIFPEKFAESDAILNQTNKFNYACENCAEKTDTITNAINVNTGITNVNQSVGNMNNQGIVLSVAVDAQDVRNGDNGDETPDGFAESQAAAEQINVHNDVHAINILFRFDTIQNSINRNTGIVSVNQAAGSMNNQGSVISIAVSLNPGVALSEADLGQTNAMNTVEEWNTVIDFDNRVVLKHDKRALIAGSILGNSGIVSVNQATGNMANQANLLSMAAAVSGLPPPGTPLTLFN